MNPLDVAGISRWHFKHRRGVWYGHVLFDYRPSRAQIKREGRHNWLSRLGVCRTRPQQSVWIGKWAPGIQRSLACLM